MLNKILISLVLTFSIINSIFANSLFKKSNPILDTFKEEFIREYEHYNKGKTLFLDKLYINFKPSSFFINQYGKVIVGACIKNKNETKEIIINENHWNSLSGVDGEFFLKKQIVFHEMGHCVLNRKHDNALYKNKIPLSIMNKSLFSNKEFYQENEALYFEELFLNNKNNSTKTISFDYYLF